MTNGRDDMTLTVYFIKIFQIKILTGISEQKNLFGQV